MGGWKKEVFVTEILENPFGVFSVQVLYFLGEMPPCRIIGIVW
jgi:hypothetical protein